MKRGADGLSLLARPLPPWFERRVVTIGPGEERPYDEGEWRDAIVVVEHGRVELEGVCGRRCSFERGDVLWLVGLPLRALHNHGLEPAVLVAISRGHRGPER